MFRNVSKISLIRSIIVTLMLIAAGIFFTGTFVSEKVAMSKGITDFNEMKTEDFIKGRFVQGTVEELHAGFAEEWEQSKGSSTKRTTSRYYLMPMYAYDENEDIKYIAVRFSKRSDIEKADKLVDEVNDYFETGKTPESFTEIELSGKISKLDKEIEGYMYDTLIDAGLGKTKDECSKYVCNYYINCKEGAAISGLIIGIVTFIAGVAAGIITLFKLR